ncbi:MAG TPA: CDP-alcohol phosphatidyltransferase family protein [Solirubrobacterales bacterium]|nr:CDP-alcohol phosphatidyltransferase family protein [Solirubrobacterales bacterium]
MKSRRLVGLDRSGPEPPATRRGQPLRPLTIPNLIGYARLAAIPVFLVLALESSDGRTVTTAVLYLAIAGGDYVDGLVARATGQYSRMGAILDPVVDRLTILAGVVVCWHFELLPRWALAVLVARELVTAALAQIGLRRGMDVEINWLGRIGVWLAMTSIFVALAIETWIATAALIAGLAFLVLATALYARVGLRRA